jgi:Domain of unknown function (DUF4352)
VRAGYLGVGSFSLMILAGGAVACGSTGTTAASLSRPATTQASTPASSTTPLARSAKAGDFAFRVLSVTETPRMPRADQCCTGSSSAGAGETFVVIKVAITNDGQLAETPDNNANEASQPAAMLTDSRGRFYSAADQAYNTSWVSGDNYNPGSTVTDKLYFAAPASVVPVRLAIPAAGYTENGQLASGSMALSALLKASLTH